jgi:hypothetical protein
MITQELLNERFTYRDGELYWKVVYSARLKAGQLAGDKDGTGYRRVMIGTKHYKMHRLIWIMFNGDIPEGMIVDHIDRNRSNNNISNLRLLDKSGNNRNRDSKGVTWDADRNKWRAQISVDDKTQMLGRFDKREQAEECYEFVKAYLINNAN